MKKLFTVLCIAVMAIFCLPVYASRPGFVKDSEWEALTLTNNERTANGLLALSTLEPLQAAALTRSDEIVSRFDHTRPSGASFSTVLGENNVTYRHAAENIAAGQSTPEAVVDGWMNSSGHRANILSGSAKHMSVGLTQTQSGYRYHWAQLFVGGCTTTAISVVDGDVVKVSCNMHADSYLPLENAKTELLPNGSMRVTYDGKTTEVTVNGGFSDVPQGAWYSEAVEYAVSHGIFNGTSATMFSPSASMTRAQFVQVLANLSGVDTSNRNVSSGFSDVPSGKWYTHAVKWASDNGIVNGVGGNRFAPNDSITREQMCVMLKNYAEYGRITLGGGSNTPFADDSSISKWAKDAVYACRAAGIINGKGANTFDPKGIATRAECATLFTGFHKNYLSK